ncbi:hypothetical protein Tco_0250979, partial [Tanacetum coccineum]
MVNLRPFPPQSHDLKNIMKKTRPVKRVDESRSLSPPFKKKKKTQQPVHDDGARSTPYYMKLTISFEARTVKRVDESQSLSPSFKKKKKMQQLVHDDGARSTPNYMKSTISFEARKVKRVDESRSVSPPFEAKKEQSPKTTTPKVKLKTDDLASGNRGSRMSSLKTQHVHDDGARSTPNYMKSTISFEARKEQSPKTTTPKVARKLKMDDLASGNKGSRMSSLKTQLVHDDGARSTPNYMKSTSSFEAKKEQSPKTT